MAVHLVIVSDVRLYREGLAHSIAIHARDIEVIGACADGAAALEVLGRYPGAIALVDVGMTDGLAQIRRLAAAVPDVTLLALALSADSEREIVATAEAGIVGYIPPEAKIEDLIEAVEHAARGEVVCSPQVAGTLVRRIARLASGRSPAGGAPTALTERETEILGLLEAGLSNKQIAQRLSIRVATVKNHVHNVLGKLNVSRRGELVAAARRSGSAPPDASEAPPASRKIPVGHLFRGSEPGAAPAGRPASDRKETPRAPS